MMMRNSGMDDFTRAYLAYGLELAEDTATDDAGEALILAQTSTYDLPQITVDHAKTDCDAFRVHARQAGKGDHIAGEVDGYSEEQAAYDFWLTRNGHGAGFWDRDLEGDAGDVLTGLAKGFGEVNFYVGDDGLVYLG